MLFPGGRMIITALMLGSANALTPPLSHLSALLLFRPLPFIVLTERWQDHRDQVLIGLIQAHTPIPPIPPIPTLRFLLSQETPPAYRPTPRTRYCILALNCSWFDQVWLCVYACMFGSVSMHVFVSSVEWSDGGAVWGMPAASLRFEQEGDVPNSAAARHTACLCRCVWNTPSRSALTFCCDFSSSSMFLTVARLYLTGSSMNGLGCRSSDADLCLVIKGNVSFFGCPVNVTQIEYVCSTTFDTHFLLKSHIFFCFREGMILFMYSLPSKGRSKHCVSNNKHLVLNKSNII